MFNSLCRSTSRLLVGVGVGGGTTLVYNVQHTTAVADHAPATQAAIRLGHDANPSRHFVSNRYLSLHTLCERNDQAAHSNHDLVFIIFIAHAALPFSITRKRPAGNAHAPFKLFFNIQFLV